MRIDLGGLRLDDGGHVEDDESNLIYMRARYYEPTSGRFISEDLNGNGSNWFLYCVNDPVNMADPTGCDSLTDFSQWMMAVGTMFALAGVAVAFIARCDPRSLNSLASHIPGFKALGLPAWLDVGTALMAFSVFFFASALAGTKLSLGLLGDMLEGGSILMIGLIRTVFAGNEAASGTLATVAMASVTLEALQDMGALLDIMNGD